MQEAQQPLQTVVSSLQDAFAAKKDAVNNKAAYHTATHDTAAGHTIAGHTAAHDIAATGIAAGDIAAHDVAVGDTVARDVAADGAAIDDNAANVTLAGTTTAGDTAADDTSVSDKAEDAKAVHYHGISSWQPSPSMSVSTVSSQHEHPSAPPSDADSYLSAELLQSHAAIDELQSSSSEEPSPQARAHAALGAVQHAAQPAHGAFPVGCSFQRREPQLYKD